MTQGVHKRLEVSLLAVLDKWVNQNCETPDGLEIGRWGTNTSALMTQAAITVLAATTDLYETLQADGELRD